MMQQQQGVPGFVGASGEGAEAGGVFSEEERERGDEGERSSAGNRWPRQETIALIRVRSEMDVAFRDSSVKGPLWEEVSRKMAEFGYHRSAKKCREKFENVYKYHKRTKEDRTFKPDGKTYRFFYQLEALDTRHPPPLLPAAPMPSSVGNGPISQQITVSSVAAPVPIAAQINEKGNANSANRLGFLGPNLLIEGPFASSESSSTSSDEEPPERRKKRKRKWKEFFGRLMGEVVEKQEEMQVKFLAELERRERERAKREEARMAQEAAKIQREHEISVRERSVAAAKDSAIIQMLQKIADQHGVLNTGPASQQPSKPREFTFSPSAPMPLLSTQQQEQQQYRQEQALIESAPPSSPQQLAQQLILQQHQQHQQQQKPPPSLILQEALSAMPLMPVPAPAPPVKSIDITGLNNRGAENILGPSPSRWPKPEVQALIHLRTTLDTKYQENGPKGPLWEEISSSMKKLGYNRNAKRCKEKWENINKYYKKVKESSKKRPEDSKTCTYFHQLDAIYRDKAIGLKIDNQMAPIMARPEQQWPIFQGPARPELNIDHHENHEEDDFDDEDDDKDGKDEGGRYEVATAE